MMMSPRPRHQLTATRVWDRITPQLPDGWGMFEATDTDDAAAGQASVPDLHVCFYGAMETDDPHEILLAIEIVSPSNPDNDCRDKSRDYAAMGIPHYLILDPRDGTWTYQWSIG